MIAAAVMVLAAAAIGLYGWIDARHRAELQAVRQQAAADAEAIRDQMQANKEKTRSPLAIAKKQLQAIERERARLQAENDRREQILMQQRAREEQAHTQQAHPQQQEQDVAQRGRDALLVVRAARSKTAEEAINTYWASATEVDQAWIANAVVALININKAYEARRPLAPLVLGVDGQLAAKAVEIVRIAGDFIPEGSRSTFKESWSAALAAAGKRLADGQASTRQDDERRRRDDERRGRDDYERMRREQEERNRKQNAIKTYTFQIDDRAEAEEYNRSRPTRPYVLPRSSRTWKDTVQAQSITEAWNIIRGRYPGKGIECTDSVGR